MTAPSGSPAQAHRRAFVVVLDACGVGALPDAADYGDDGTDTLGHLARIEGGLELPVLGGLGLGRLTDIAGVPPSTTPAIHGRLAAIGPGKDSIAGHRGLMGVALPAASPQWPDGVPADELAAMERAAGHRLLAGAVTDGLRALDRWGTEHLRTGRPILYTSAVDSVLQIAAHVDRVPVDELHALCRRLHAGLPAELRPARVVARPFRGPEGAFVRTPGRIDVATPPTTPSHLDVLRDRGTPVHGVGKVVDVFAGRGFDTTRTATTNAGAIDALDELLGTMTRGLAFVNLVETDDRFGHRKDTAGFHAALRDIDAATGRWLERLGPEDLLVLTADHGVDPAAPHAFHTREHAPLLAVAAGPDGTAVRARHDGVLADVGATVVRWLTGADAPELPGRSFVA
ncbi:phosphopentomutase [Patulibacter minatonensis]|uniref:phosphopentomutase n=1 Tax=Patulibacter minatonensis TaxID=298163 RepID=UPI0004B67374|nr:phosphopentomutase [Patulibacter minatonensis]